MSSNRKHKSRGVKHFSLTDASESDAKGYGNANHRHSHERGNPKRVTALIAKVEENSFIDPYISFDVGLGGKGAIEVSEDGSGFTFRKSGLYQLIFSGEIDLRTASEGNFIFEQTPVQDDQKHFTFQNISSGHVNISTILSFRRGNSLRLTVIPLIGGVAHRTEFPIVGGGSKFQIIRVSDI